KTTCSYRASAKKANVALVAAAPLNVAIAVPVDADAKIPAALYAPKAVTAPDTTPPAAPFAKEDAITDN
ncbi:hypothetical protein Q604_UNBC04287G0001, partial [human gut metagenome]